MSTTSPTKELTTDIATLLGLADMTATERANFLTEIGELVLHSAFLRLVAGLEETEAKEAQTLLDSSAGGAALDALAERFPEFLQLFFEEVQAFRDEVRYLLA